MRRFSTLMSAVTMVTITAPGLAQKAVQKAAVSSDARFMIPNPYSKIPQCGFKRVPGLKIRDEGPGIARARYNVESREGLKAKATMFIVAKPPTERWPASWQGLNFEVPAFVLPDTSVPDRVAASVKLFLDGKPFIHPHRLARASPDSIVNDGSTMNAIMDDIRKNMELLQALSTTSVAVMRVYDSRGSEMNAWTFDVAPFRLMTATLATSGWTCAGVPG